MYDLKITGGTIVDGTGRPGFTGDVAVTDGRIVAIGACPGPATRTLDAQGAHVLPGFVDIHTHYDGQVSWDEELSPSSTLGVTTCVMGSCGVGFAPVRPGRETTLVELMEGVEDIPGSALAEGIPWGWESFEDYMAVVAAMPHAIDFLLQVPHDPLRMYVMGDRAVAEEVATDADPALAVAGTAAGAAYVGAFLAFYGVYEWLHRRDHTHPGIGAHGRWVRRHHFHHHFVDGRTNFGVTSPVWDRVFGTYREPAVIRVPPKLVMAWLLDPATGDIRAEHAGTYQLGKGAR